MTDFTFKNQSVAGVALALIVGGGGFNMISEGNEDEELERLDNRLTNADVLQNADREKLEESLANVLQMINDQRIEMALLRQRVNQL